MDALLDTKEACALLKVSRVSLYNYVRKKEIPAFKFGRRWKFKKDSLEKWIEQKVQESNKTIKQ